MQSSIHALEFVFLLLLLFIVVFGLLSKKLKIPYPIVFVLGGLLLSFVPGIPRINLNPDIIFFVVLPPLLYRAARLTLWRDFSYNLLSILFLAFGLVTFTILGVTALGHWFLPGFDWRVCLVLGAVVAPTDAIAATTIAKRVGLPKRIVNVLEGESLLNDATALLALEFGLALLVGGERPTFTFGLLRLSYLIAVGILIGLVIASLVENRIDDGPIEIALSILTPYVAYLTADALHASGVLAVLACGLYLSRKSSQFFSPKVRLQVRAVWNSLDFALNGLVFVLIGLELPYVLGNIPDHRPGTLITCAVAFSAFLILLRLMWVFPGAYIANLVRRRILHQDEPLPSARQIFIVGWTGMRGVISLATAIALPLTFNGGSTFAQRNMIIFLAFSAIVVTLVLQGLTLPRLIRALGFAADSVSHSSHRDLQDARRAILNAALQHLDNIRGKAKPELVAVYDDLSQGYRSRLAGLSEEGTVSTDGVGPGFYKKYVEVYRKLMKLERQTAVRLRNERRISDELLRELQLELDLSESRFPIQGT